MKCTEILSHVDHTLLSPTAAWTEIKEICAQAIKYRTASVCIPPCYAARVRREFGEALRLCVVIGFPLGYDTTAAKTAAARQELRFWVRSIFLSWLFLQNPIIYCLLSSL